MMFTGKCSLSLLYLAIFSGFILLLNRQFNENFGKNECAMTFMWRRIMLMDVGFKDYNHYSLFLYGESHYAQYFLNTKNVNGIPIIFIPGNAGSGRQVRSLASVLQNKTESRNMKFHFDVYGVDFNEEFSGIHSSYLIEHSKFLKNAVKHVWSLYKKPPPGIILYGHSLGGVVSQLVLEDEEIRNKISMVLALASPFNEPPFPIDEQMIRIWHRLHEMKTKVPIISVDGGLRDELIDPEWTYAPFVLHASSTEIDDVWLETDHQCIVWCNQIIRQNTRFLFDYARAPNKFAENHVTIFNKHFKNSRQYVKPTKSSPNSTFISPNECNPKCPIDGILKLDSNFNKSTFVSISNIFSSQLSVDNKIIGEFDACGREKICSFYSGNSNGLVDLKGKDAWILKGNVNDSLQLSAFNPILHRFDFTGMKMLTLNFDYPLFIYRLKIKPYGPIQNVIFKSEKSKQLSRKVGDNLHHSMIINLIGFNDSDPKLYFFGNSDTHIVVEFEFDLINSIVKILRTSRVYLISSLVLFHLVHSLIRTFNIYSLALSTLAISILSRIWFDDYILISAIILFDIFVYLSILALNNFISPIFQWLHKKTVALNELLKLTLFAGIFAGAIYTHSFPLVVIIAISILNSTPNLSNLLIWIEIFLFLQFPSGFEFIFGVTKYRQFIYPWSSFTVSSLLFILNSCVYLIKFKSKVFIGLLEIFVVAWILYNRQIDSLLALDSLAFIPVLFMNLELNVFH